MTGGKLPTITLRRVPPAVRSNPEADRVWRAVTTVVEKMPGINPNTFEMFIKPLTVVGTLDGSLCIHGPRYAASWVRRRYGAMLTLLVRDEGTFSGLSIYEYESAGGTL
jgi:hypothetical protein